MRWHCVGVGEFIGIAVLWVSVTMPVELTVGIQLISSIGYSQSRKVTWDASVYPLTRVVAISGTANNRLASVMSHCNSAVHPTKIATTTLCAHCNASSGSRYHMIAE